MPSERTWLRTLALIAALVTFLITFAGVLRALYRDWLNDDNYSHGILIVPLALRSLPGSAARSWRACTPQPSAVGLVVVVGSLAILVAGTLGAELFLTRISILGMLVGAVLFLLGWPYLRVLAFPAGVPAADDSDSGDHLQSDRVSAAAVRVAVRHGRDGGSSAFRCCARATSSSSRTRSSRSPRRAAGSGRSSRC